MQKLFKSVEYSPDVDALVITLSDKPPEYGEGLGDGIIIHFDFEESPLIISDDYQSEKYVSSIPNISIKDALLALMKGGMP